MDPSFSLREPGSPGAERGRELMLAAGAVPAGGGRNSATDATAQK